MLFSTPFFTLDQDWEVPIPGFMILAPKRKVRGILDFTSEEAAEYAELVPRVRRAMQDVGIETVYLFCNEDSRHGFHLWFFPRYEWMAKWDRGPRGMKEIMDYAEKEMKFSDEVENMKAKIKEKLEFLK